jgi:type IV secretion system protein VirB10
VSPNNTHRTGDDSRHGNATGYEPHQGGSDPLASNPYSAQYHRAAEPDLDANAPVLKSTDLARMNRRALYFLAIVVALLLLLGFWLIKSATHHDNTPRPKPEAVVIPSAPPVPPPLPQPTQPPVQAQAIPVLRSPAPAPVQASPGSIMTKAMSLLQRREMDSNGQAGSDSSNNTMQEASASLGLPGSDATAASDKPSQANLLKDPDTLMVRGTYIRCVLETRIITDIPGFTSCIVTEPVYSFDGRALLLPKGSKVLGKYQAEPNGSRVAVIWDRIITPNGINVDMSSPGVDPLGGAGYPGHVDSHWGSRISAALLISMLSDAFSYEAAEHGPRTASISNGVVVETPFQSRTADTLQDLAGQAVRKAANRPVTVTINQGTIVDVYVTRDVDFSGVASRL